MRPLIALLFCSMLAGTIDAQKIVEKHLSYATGKTIDMNIQIADSIRIITWSKNEVYVKASVNVNNNKNNDMYVIGFDEAGSDIDIHAKFAEDKMESTWSDSCNCRCTRSKIYWDVFIPENATFAVETIDGNITIEGKTAEIKAHSISGFIDLSFATARKADLKMSTISGTIYTNVAIAKPKNSRGGNSVSSAYNGGGQRVDLETISGDIFLRKTE